MQIRELLAMHGYRHVHQYRQDDPPVPAATSACSLPTCRVVDT
jgi:hypothetical protein